MISTSAKRNNGKSQRQVSRKRTCAPVNSTKRQKSAGKWSNKPHNHYTSDKNKTSSHRITLVQKIGLVKEIQH